MPEVRIVLFGSGSVGKSAITLQFISNKFLEFYDPTIEDSYRKQINLDGTPFVLEILGPYSLFLNPSFFSLSFVECVFGNRKKIIK